jgi:hypothetical protein
VICTAANKTHGSAVSADGLTLSRRIGKPEVNPEPGLANFPINDALNFPENGIFGNLLLSSSSGRGELTDNPLFRHLSDQG